MYIYIYIYIYIYAAPAGTGAIPREYGDLRSGGVAAPFPEMRSPSRDPRRSQDVEWCSTVCYSILYYSIL